MSEPMSEERWRKMRTVAERFATGSGQLQELDAAWLAAAVPDLLAEIERLRTVLRAIAEGDPAGHDLDLGYKVAEVDCYQYKRFIEAARRVLGMPGEDTDE